MRLILDVTETSRTPFISGVGRIVRDFARDNADVVWLVRFDPKSASFRFVREIPKLALRPRSAQASSLHHHAHRVLLTLRSAYLGISRRHPDAASVVSTALRALSRRWLHKARLTESIKWTDGPIWHPTCTDVFIVIEVVGDPRHQQAVAGAASAGAKLAFYVHDLIPICHPEVLAGDSLLFRAAFLGYLDLVAMADLVFANSHHTASQYRQFLGLRKGRDFNECQVHYPPRPKRSNDSSSVNKATFRSGIHLLGVGSLERRKNFAVVVEAVALLRARGVDVSLTLVRNELRGENGETLEAIRRAGDSVKVLDMVSDSHLEEIYLEHDIVVVPSLAEGFGLPVLEGATRGRAVIASDIPVFRELQEFVGFELADPKDPQSWMASILASAKQGKPSISEDVFPADWIGLGDKILEGLGRTRKDCLLARW